MNRRIILNWVIALAVITMLPGPSSLHAQNSCQPVFDALDKVFMTPSHSYSTYTIQGRTITAEAIYTRGKAFDLENSKWMLRPKGPKELLEEEAEHRKHGTVICKIVSEESVNGQPATLYSLHSKTEQATAEAQLWIAKNTGLLLREEMDVDGGKSKSHVSTRYEYRNIQAPM